VKRYQVRPDYIANIAWERGYLNTLELFRIAAWKTGQGLGSLTLNSEEDIKDRTRSALECIRPWRGRNVVGLNDPVAWSEWRETARSAIGVQATNAGLLGLQGVGYPMASAILDILDPQVWPVIDKYGVRTVFGVRPDGSTWPSTRWQRAAVYEAYARHLANLGAASWDPGLSIHKLDQEAMRASMPGGELPSGWRFAVLPAV
jgi:hypothetical protein